MLKEAGETKKEKEGEQAMRKDEDREEGRKIGTKERRREKK